MLLFASIPSCLVLDYGDGYDPRQSPIIQGRITDYKGNILAKVVQLTITVVSSTSQKLATVAIVNLIPLTIGARSIAT